MRGSFAMQCGCLLAIVLASYSAEAKAQPVASSLRELPGQLDWQPIYQGVELATIEIPGKNPCRGKALRIDAAHPHIDFVLTPSNGAAPGETNGMKTSTFARATGAQIAINAAPFSPVHAKEGLPQDITGLHVVNGEVVSLAQAGYAALLISRDSLSSISTGPFDTTELYNAVGGFQVVLSAGNVVGNQNEGPHPRTAAGVSADGRTLVLMVIDGRQPRHSTGATTAELGQWLRAAGAHDGVNLDGGGTSTLVLVDADGAVRVANRPIHNGIPGQERVAASHLGIKAAPLKSP